MAFTMASVHPGVRIGHVHLKVADLDRALRFYRDVLGFELTQRDRPADEWPRAADGRLAMFTRRLDIDGLLREGDTAAPSPPVGSGPRDP